MGKTITKKPEKKVEKKEAKYKVVFEINGTTTTLTGNTLVGVINSFERPPFVKTDFVVKASNGKKTIEHIIPVMKARRTLQNRIAVQLLASNLSKQLG